jgi:hypothetical protein
LVPRGGGVQKLRAANWFAGAKVRDMALQVDIADPTTIADWDERILSIPGVCFFHSSSWARVLEESYGYKPMYFNLRDGNELVALAPTMEVRSFLTGKRGVSLPFTDYCQILATELEQSSVLRDSILKYAEENRWDYVEWRSPVMDLADSTRYAQYYLHTLDLDEDEGKIYSNLKSSVRRNIKKAEKAGVQVRLSQSRDSLMAFYKLHLTTRKEHGLPPQPVKFFSKVHEHIIAKGNGITALASYRDQIIAAAVYFHFGNDALYKYGASRRELQHLRANNYLMWEAIKHYCINGFSRFSFGRTSTGNLGLLQFKRGWGATERPMNYYRYNFKKSAFIEGRPDAPGLHKIFAIMPTPVLKLVGTLLYRHFG